MPFDLRPWFAALPRRFYWAALAYVGLAALLIHDWDGFVFQSAVRDLWAGRSPYEVASEAPWHGFLGIGDTHVQWYAYPPLPLLLMALTYAPALLMDLPAPVGRVLLKLPVIIGGLVLARVAGAWAVRLGRPDKRDLVERAMLWNPFILLVGPVWGMTDGLLMACFLFGVLRFYQGRTAEAGLWVSAAVLIKPFALLLALPVLAHALATRPWGDVRRAALSGAGLVALVAGPFAIADPHGFWTQVVAFHLERPAQGLTVWSWWPLSAVPADVASTASLVVMALALVGLSVAATRLPGPDAPLWAAFGAAAVVLALNRVLNEQYVVMVIAPFVLLAYCGGDAARRAGATVRAAWAATWVAALTVVLVGFHFVTFIPPDIAMPLFGRPVDAVAHSIRMATPWLWSAVSATLAILLPLVVIASAVIAARRALVAFGRPGRIEMGAATPSVFAAIVLAVLAVAPTAAPAALDPSVGAEDVEPTVATFYYLWWNNPAHDPDVLYGNWFPVSQSPSMGYYTNTRGVAREHVSMMRDNGIDAAIVSYHRGEWDRYKVFLEEAERGGLKQAPLIELNQVYDQPEHHPITENGTKVPYAAYRLNNSTRLAIEAFVLDVRDAVTSPSAWRIDGKPVVFFYDSYVSGVGFHPEDKRDLAKVLVDLVGYQSLRDSYGDPNITTIDDVVRHYPEHYKEFFYGRPNAHLWREAHLELHRRFWNDLRADLEEQIGPLFLVSGDAYNERAGFETGTIKSLVDLELFDGSFIYSPSFTWGTNAGRPFIDNFRLWEDRNLWMQAFADAQRRASVVGLAPAYDDTVNRPAHGFVIPAVVEGRDFYDISWESVQTEPPTAVGIATFNEFFEGSSIEPSVEFGDRWLRATPGHAAAFKAAAPQAGLTVALVHEWESRLHPDYPEQDEPHAWGLDLIAAGVRARPDHVVAVDGRLGATLADTPSLVLVEGGRPDYGVSDRTAGMLATWHEADVPIVLFGPTVSDAIPVPFGECADALATLDKNWTLMPGDVVRAEGEAVLLDRSGKTLLVGARCEDGVSLTRFKPWGSDADTDAACLDVVLGALVPDVHRSKATSCRAP